jgi:hypothetical protein
LDEDGNPTDQYYTMTRVFVKPYTDNQDAIQIVEIDDKPSYYDVENKRFVLNYRYKLPHESSWYEISETMRDTRFINI